MPDAREPVPRRPTSPRVGIRACSRSLLKDDWWYGVVQSDLGAVACAVRPRSRVAARFERCAGGGSRTRSRCGKGVQIVRGATWVGRVPEGVRRMVPVSSGRCELLVSGNVRCRGRQRFRSVVRRSCGTRTRGTRPTCASTTTAAPPGTSGSRPRPADASTPTRTRGGRSRTAARLRCGRSPRSATGTRGTSATTPPAACGAESARSGLRVSAT